jgi:hypothetical protein
MLLGLDTENPGLGGGQRPAGVFVLPAIIPVPAAAPMAGGFRFLGDLAEHILDVLFGPLEDLGGEVPRGDQPLDAVADVLIFSEPAQELPGIPRRTGRPVIAPPVRPAVVAPSGALALLLRMLPVICCGPTVRTVVVIGSRLPGRRLGWRRLSSVLALQLQLSLDSRARDVGRIPDL